MLDAQNAVRYRHRLDALQVSDFQAFCFTLLFPRLYRILYPYKMPKIDDPNFRMSKKGVLNYFQLLLKQIMGCECRRQSQH